MTRFGFSADIAIVSAMNGIDAFEAINAANHDYGRNNVPLPSIGVSGYCLTKDPYYLDIGGGQIWGERGFHSTWISARKAADFQITMAVERISGFLSGLRDNPVIVIAGATYKEDVDDCRLSHGRELADLLSSRGFEIIFWDPMVSEDILDGFPVYKEYECIANTDCLIFTVPHKDFKEWAKEMHGIEKMRTMYIFDGWGIVRNSPEGVIVHGTGKPDQR
jgi:UDP-N-acetyl-D-mannosaminuronate dehydrogenase